MATNKVPTVQDLINGPATPFWILAIIPTLLEKDPIDVAGELEVMAAVFRERANDVLALELPVPCQGSENVDGSTLCLDAEGKPLPAKLRTVQDENGDPIQVWYCDDCAELRARAGV